MDDAPKQTYLDRKKERAREGQPVPLDIVIEAQTLACRGYTVDKIVERLRGRGATREQVVRAITPVEESEARRPARPTRANIGNAKMKRNFGNFRK